MRCCSNQSGGDIHALLQDRVDPVADNAKEPELAAGLIDLMGDRGNIAGAGQQGTNIDWSKLVVGVCAVVHG